MSLEPGAKLAHYEILESVGKGGMGEVFRARDTKLEREVAIKVLPEEFADDEQRVSRFEREAKLLASLNHPNIASIYGFESNALVLELVEGPTLADRIEQGPIPVEECIAIAKQIAEALESGHDTGVIHRDLKPANIKLREDGTVKVLDYGLAKALEGEAAASSDSDLSQSPTMTRQGTQIGVILGTAAYMSPEQASGKRVDKRTDIFAFGCVLFEMLTGRTAFTGETAGETLAAVIRSEPEWETLPSDLAPTARKYLMRCLEKDAKRRVRDIGDVRLALQGSFDVTPPPSRAPGSWRRTLAFAAVSGAVFSAVTWLSMTRTFRDASTPPPVARVSVPMPPGASPREESRRFMEISPDGSHIVFPADGQLYLRAMNRNEAEPIAGTTGGRLPFFSPDGEWVGFDADGELKKVAIGGGVPVSLCETKQLGGAHWNTDSTIVFADRGAGILRVSADGGTPEVLVSFPEWAEVARVPQMLPGNKAVLFTITYGGNWADSRIVVESLETDERTVLFEQASDARYLPTGHLVFQREGTLLAAPFDVDTLSVTGSAVRMVEDVMTAGVASVDAQYSTSDTGSLLYVPDTPDDGSRTLVWVDRDGNEEPIAAPSREYAAVRISPDRSRVVLSERDQREIWIWDFRRETLTQFTFSPSVDMAPMWTPDGSRVAFGSARAGLPNLFWKAADGTGAVERMSESANVRFPHAFTPDGQQLIFSESDGRAWDVGMLSIGGSAELLLATEFDERNPALSPDGQWLAFELDASGRTEIYVRPFPNVHEGQWAISKDGGTMPVWAKNGKELFYLAPDGTLKAVGVETEPGFIPGNATALFSGYYQGQGNFATFDVSADGERFLMIKEDAASGAAAFILVQNWFEELERLVPIDE